MRIDEDQFVIRVPLEDYFLVDPDRHSSDADISGFLRNAKYSAVFVGTGRQWQRQVHETRET